MDGINWHSFFFLLLALVTCAFSLAVVLTSNVVRMAFYLVITLGATAGLFFLAGADFVGAMQLMIYVGGTLVLLIFGVMLTSQGPFVSMKTRGGEWVLAMIVGGAMLLLLIPTAFSVESWKGPSREELAEKLDRTDQVTATKLGAALTGLRTDKLSGYLFPFEIISMHLLVVLVGAAYLARAKKRRVERS